MAGENTTPKPVNLDSAAPEWASRLLPIPEFADIVGENPSTIYRKIEAGIYPGLIHLGSSSRLAGWECWGVLKKRLAERDASKAA